VRFQFLRIEGEHLLHANWPVETANGLHCHTAHANWPLQTAIINDRAVYNAIHPVRRCASTITKKHATLNPEKDTLKRGELDDQANPTFPQEHGVDKYGGHIPGTAGEALGSSNAQPYFSSQVRMGPWTTEEEEEE
jgi:hypothetical protein